MSQHLQGMTITGVLGEEQVVRNTFKILRGFPARVVKWFWSLLRLGRRVWVLEALLRSDTVVARNFYLTDRRGKVRGAFGLLDDDSPYLSLYDAERTTRLHCLLMDDGTPRVSLCDASGVGRVTLDVGESPAVTVNDAAGELVCELVGPGDGPGEEGRDCWN